MGRTAADNEGVPGVALAVLGDDIDVTVAAGDPNGWGALTPERPFRIASNTKTFVAAAVLRLAERGELSIDDTLSVRADPALELLGRDGHAVNTITIRQLLLHTSGIADFAADVDYVTNVLGDPSRRWTRADQVRWAMVHADPLGQPGTTYGYSDTGYVLLGDVIERATGRPLGAGVDGLLDLERLGLTSTGGVDGGEARPLWRVARAHVHQAVYGTAGALYELADVPDAKIGDRRVLSRLIAP